MAEQTTITSDTVRSLADKLERLTEGLSEEERITLSVLLATAGDQIRRSTESTGVRFGNPAEFSKAFDASFGRLAGTGPDDEVRSKGIIIVGG